MAEKLREFCNGCPKLKIEPVVHTGDMLFSPDFDRKFTCSRTGKVLYEIADINTKIERQDGCKEV